MRIVSATVRQGPSSLRTGDETGERKGGRHAWVAAVLLLGGLVAPLAAAGATSLGLPAGGVLPAGQGPSSNLLMGDQSSFAGSSGGWVGVKAAVSWVAAPSYSGAGALSVSPQSATGASVWSGNGSGGAAGGDTQAVPGDVYAGGAMVDSVSGEVIAQPALAFFSAGGGFLGGLWGQVMALDPGRWTALAPVVGIAPSGAAWVVLGIGTNGSTAGSRMDVDAASLRSSPGGSPAVDGPLSVSGNKILQSDGSPVVLRGIVLYGLEASANPPIMSENELLQAKAWGANMIRLPLGEQLWLSTSCQYDSNYESAVAGMVRSITSLGMVALLDLHFNSVSPCGPAGQQPMADYPGSVEFWQQVSAQFGSNPLVAFDLYNEPHGLTTAQWLHGGPVNVAPSPPFEAAGMQQLYDAVRSSGTSDLVVVSGNDWATSFPGALVKGYNIAYGVHSYSCPFAPPPRCGSPDPYSPPFLASWAKSAAGVPVIVSEFGWPSTLSGTFDANVIAFAQARGWGWSVFAWDGSTSGIFDLLASVPKLGSYEPAPSGMPVLAALSGLS